MNDSLKPLFRENIRLTFLFILLPVILSLIFWPEPEKFLAAAGIIYGALLALCSLYMICRQSEALASDLRGKSYFIGSYALRYLMYAVFLLIGAGLKIPILAMLIGAAASKLALFFYAKKDSADQSSEQQKKRELAEIEDQEPVLSMMESEKPADSDPDQ